ncbi:tRNA (5-methylaminomethyl-2-thiouridine)(34)-methyltransferase MnmD [Desulfurobacterium indicum]|uniref:tRNA (5-methylaminomethyl-2-thiouridine)(34)-methyltransferase MnmD n=1 Tax=Desulfurobacterium indicum TaxID=1914305 RepID=UPI001FE4BC95|nr:MnmC family methyltransferase [Desulfurobacterium indicum]
MIKKIITADGSPTFFSEEYGEPYHSVTAGAFRESEEKFIKPCKIIESLKKRDLKILDVCFGLGFNSMSAVKAAFECGGKLLIVGFEKDIEVIKASLQLDWGDMSAFKFFLSGLLKNRSFEDGFLTLNYFDGKIGIKVFIGEGREVVKKIYRNFGDFFDVVFHDPFSPKVNPELWTLDFFKYISEMVKEGGVLATYSSSLPVRKALLMAGFGVREGVAVGRKSKSTVAVKGRKSLLPDKFKKKLETSLFSVPYRDLFLNDPPALIRNRRSGCIHILESVYPFECLY